MVEFGVKEYALSNKTHYFSLKYSLLLFLCQFISKNRQKLHIFCDTKFATLSLSQYGRVLHPGNKIIWYCFILLHILSLCQYVFFSCLCLLRSSRESVFSQGSVTKVYSFFENFKKISHFCAVIEKSVTDTSISYILFY